MSGPQQMDWEGVSRALDRPLDSSHVRTREQSGRKLSYITAARAIETANAIFGHGAWSREIIMLDLVANELRNDPRKGERHHVSYVARVRVTVGGVVRDGTGAGHGIDKDAGIAHESAAKEAESDAMKRALITFGHPLGLALYDKDAPRVGDNTAPATRSQIENVRRALSHFGVGEEKAAASVGANDLSDLSESQCDRLMGFLRRKAEAEYAAKQAAEKAAKQEGKA